MTEDLTKEERLKKKDLLIEVKKIREEGKFAKIIWRRDEMQLISGDFRPRMTSTSTD